MKFFKSSKGFFELYMSWTVLLKLSPKKLSSRLSINPLLTGELSWGLTVKILFCARLYNLFSPSAILEILESEYVGSSLKGFDPCLLYRLPKGIPAIVAKVLKEVKSPPFGSPFWLAWVFTEDNESWFCFVMDSKPWDVP